MSWQNGSSLSGKREVSDTLTNASPEAEANQRAILVEWLNSINPHLNLPTKASDEELRACLIDGSLLSQILKRLRLVSDNEVGNSHHSSVSSSEYVRRFLETLDKLGIPGFAVSDLEKGCMKPVIGCLLKLRPGFSPAKENLSINTKVTKSGNLQNDEGLPSPVFGEERRKVLSESKINGASRSSLISEQSAALLHNVGHKFPEVLQLKQGHYSDLPAVKISEMMKSNALDNAPTASLLSVVNGILDESVDRKNGEIPYRVACLLRKVVQEIERRISTQAEHLRTQNNLFKAREEKYQSRIQVLEALASATGEETELVMKQLQQVKSEKPKVEEKKELREENAVELAKEKEQSSLEISALKQELELTKKRCLQAETEAKEKEQSSLEISALKQELELTKKTYELRCLQVETEAEEKEQSSLEISALKQELELTKKAYELRCLQVETEAEEKEQSSLEISALKQELELTKKTYELHCLQVETEANTAKEDLQAKVIELEGLIATSRTEVKEIEGLLTASRMEVKEIEGLLTASRNEVKELEEHSDSRNQGWTRKANICRSFLEFQLGVLRELKLSSHSIKQEVLKTQKSLSDDFNSLGLKLKELAHAAENYHSVLAENRQLFNEVQELKGNIRVYCRTRPFLPKQTGKSCIEHIGDNGEIIISNPSKPGKDGQRMFKFSKVYGPAATQVEVFSDIQPFIRSVLDGYNVCIFAYGQTGSGKTYTMSGPNGASEKDLGVNFRALNYLFNTSQSRGSSINYEVEVQMIEIYNEQVRDLLSSDGSQKKLGILSSTQANGLAVPDATMHPVRVTADVMELIDLGFKNRVVSSTALNERSSRSHSVVTIHVRGKDLKTGSPLYGNLHLVDLAGSERVDRSEVTGDRLKEAQHINKSLSALGDVIFALAQKSSHVPYRNSKLTQLLQSSLGGRAKTIMFVQLNPDATSFTESLGTLKFAERVSGVELGAAKSSKEGRDVRELMEQLASLKDTIAKKDEEIERLNLIKS